MFSQFSSFSVPKFGFGRSTTTGAIDIPSVEVHNVETQTDRRGRGLKHLLKLNHANYSILYNKERFHNHTPHALGTAFLLGGSADHLNDLYEDATTHDGLEPWRDSPQEIALHDYREFLSLREYQRAWVDFFEDELVTGGEYEWRKVVNKFLFEEGPNKDQNPYPIFQSVVAGLGHPLIHLGYAYELNSRDIAMEALGLAATCYDPEIAKLLDTALPAANIANPVTYSTSNPFEVFARVNGDTRLNGKFHHPGGDNMSQLFTDDALKSILLEHWAAWKITDPKKQFEQSQQLATALLISTASSLGGHGYDFFLVHLLTTSHAVRIILPEIEAKYHLQLVREWWLITLAIYIAQLRPVVKQSTIREYPLNNKSWQSVTDLALFGKHKFDAHYIKALRAMKAAAATWGDDDQYFLKAALKFGTEFDDWGGFGAEEQEHEAEVEQEKKRSRRQGSPY